MRTAWLLAILVATSACSGKPKSPPGSGAAPGAAPSAPAVSGGSDASGTGDSVWVERSDGGQQCAVDSIQPLEQGRAELAQLGIRVLEEQKKSDGRMRIQVCGQPTGNANAYRIPKESLPKAEAIGFKASQ